MSRDLLLIIIGLELLVLVHFAGWDSVILSGFSIGCWLTWSRWGAK